MVPPFLRPSAWRLVVGVAVAVAAVFAAVGIAILARRHAPASPVVVPPPGQTTGQGSGTSAASSGPGPNTRPTVAPPGPGAVTFHYEGVTLQASDREGVSFRRDPILPFALLATWTGAEVEVCFGPDPGASAPLDEEGCRPLSNGSQMTILPDDRSTRSYYVQLTASGAVLDLDLRLTYVASPNAVPPVADLRLDLSHLAPGGRRACDLGELSDLAVSPVSAVATWNGSGPLTLSMRRHDAIAATVSGPSPLQVTGAQPPQAQLWQVILESPVGAADADAVGLSIRFPLGASS